MMDELLARVEKPARYTGGEYNAVMKEPAGLIRFAFAFPDVYEVGMSHMGLKILYKVLNDRPDTWCERVFAPWVDMEQALAASGEKLRTLESGTPLCEMDFVGFTLQYEMSYTNILTMLHLGGVELLAEKRECGPFVVLGGPCAYNPEPLADFADLVVLGDGEEVVDDIMDCYAMWKRSGGSRKDFLTAAAKLQGVYVPSLYDVSYNADGTVEKVTPNHPNAPALVQRKILWDLENAPAATRPPVPFVEAVHDRSMVEIMRGCTRGCRFCQAGMIYRPVRERTADTVVAQCCDIAENTGYEELSLSSLSTGDYSGLHEMMPKLMEAMARRKVDVSVPSLRVDSQLEEILPNLRRAGLTVAPEAGSQRLRDVINKNITLEEIRSAASRAFANGWSSVKLYFMMGLPTETEEDVAAIADVANTVLDQYYATPKGVRKPGLRVTVSVACFVPKPFTPFQWCSQDEMEVFDKKQHILMPLLRRHGLEYRWHDATLSYWEAAFARGDRRLGRALLRAWQLGCRFDGWRDQFKPDMWKQAMAETGLDPAFYATRGRDVTEVLPWDHLSCGVTKAFLLREYKNALAEKTTPDCREKCINCGIREGGCRNCASR